MGIVKLVAIKPFSQYSDINDFYRKTKMNREKTFNFLISELNKSGDGLGNYGEGKE